MVTHRWIGTCPLCKQYSILYVYIWRDKEGVQTPDCFQCMTCGQSIMEDETKLIHDLKEAESSEL